MMDAFEKWWSDTPLGKIQGPQVGASPVVLAFKEIAKDAFLAGRAAGLEDAAEEAKAVLDDANNIQKNYMAGAPNRNPDQYETGRASAADIIECAIRSLITKAPE